MREHNFALSKTRLSNDPLREIWECKQCDSVVSFKKGMEQAPVNRHMGNRMHCLDPIFKPLDEVIDNRTTIIKPQKTASGIYTGKN